MVDEMVINEQARMLASRAVLGVVNKVSDDAGGPLSLPSSQLLNCRELVQRSAELAFDAYWPRFMADEEVRRANGERSIFDLLPPAPDA